MLSQPATVFVLQNAQRRQACMGIDETGHRESGRGL
jgi:hypothetical protein